MSSRIFLGQTTHQRHTPRGHAFAYRMFWLALDPDQLPMLHRTVRGFAHNRRWLASLHDADYAGPGHGSIRRKITAIIAAAGVTEPPRRITLITIPRVMGYVFNPVSFYLCYGHDGKLRVFVAEVRNTFGEMHHYVAQPLADAADPTLHRLTLPKSFYVSPFLDVDGRYELTLRTSEDTFDLSIDLHQAGGVAFSATMRGQGQPLTSARLLAVLARLPLFAATIMWRIHWQAIKLRVLKGIATQPKPAPSHPDTLPTRAPSCWYAFRQRLVKLASRTERITTAATQPK